MHRHHPHSERQREHVQGVVFASVMPVMQTIHHRKKRDRNNFLEKKRAEVQHLIMELYGCDHASLQDRTLLETTFDRLPLVLDMQRVSPVTIYPITTSDPRDDGLSGFVVIATSHIAFHAWPGYNTLSCDVFSCEPYHTEEVLAYLQAIFQSKDVEVYTVERGTRFARVPKHPLRAATERSASV